MGSSELAGPPLSSRTSYCILDQTKDIFHAFLYPTGTEEKEWNDLSSLCKLHPLFPHLSGQNPLFSILAQPIYLNLFNGNSFPKQYPVTAAVLVPIPLHEGGPSPRTINSLCLENWVLVQAAGFSSADVRCACWASPCCSWIEAPSPEPSQFSEF